MQPDRWTDWLLHRRNGNDLAHERSIQAATQRFCERVLDNARLSRGMTLADIGSSGGLVALNAIERIGPSLKVILIDVSSGLLDHARAAAVCRDVERQCTFLRCAADELKDIRDSSVDVVTTRSVLAYVADKAAAFREFLRILKPGGRISLAEPIFLDDAFETVYLRGQLDSKNPDPFLPLMHRWKSAQFSDTLEKIAASPLAQHSERDLVRLLHSAGFSAIHLELHIDIVPGNNPSWDVFLDIAPHPLAPTLREILDGKFCPDERVAFESAMRPTIESGDYVQNERMAYITASKPAA